MLTLPLLICASPVVCPVTDSFFQMAILHLSTNGKQIILERMHDMYLMFSRLVLYMDLQQ